MKQNKLFYVVKEMSGRKEESANNVSGSLSASDFSRLLRLADISDRENLES